MTSLSHHLVQSLVHSNSIWAWDNSYGWTFTKIWEKRSRSLTLTYFRMNPIFPLSWTMEKVPRIMNEAFEKNSKWIRKINLPIGIVKIKFVTTFSVQTFKILWNSNLSLFQWFKMNLLKFWIVLGNSVFKSPKIFLSISFTTAILNKFYIQNNFFFNYFIPPKMAPPKVNSSRFSYFIVVVYLVLKMRIECNHFVCFVRTVYFSLWKSSKVHMWI